MAGRLAGRLSGMNAAPGNESLPPLTNTGFPSMRINMIQPPSKSAKPMRAAFPPLTASEWAEQAEQSKDYDAATRTANGFGISLLRARALFAARHSVEIEDEAAARELDAIGRRREIRD